MKPTTSNLASSRGLPKHIIKFHQNKKWVWPWARRALQILWLPYTAERLKLVTSNLACSWGLPSPIIKSHPEKVGVALEWGGLRKMWGFPCNISATAEAAEFKFGAQLVFAKNRHKITRILMGDVILENRN